MKSRPGPDRPARMNKVSGTEYDRTPPIPRRVRIPFHIAVQSLTFSAASMGTRTSHAYPEEAATRCRSATMAMEGNLPEQATRSFR
jgi:hypothetical protein